jgi:hypothetical protein
MNKKLSKTKFCQFCIRSNKWLISPQK